MAGSNDGVTVRALLAWSLLMALVFSAIALDAVQAPQIEKLGRRSYVSWTDWRRGEMVELLVEGPKELLTVRHTLLAVGHDQVNTYDMTVVCDYPPDVLQRYWRAKDVLREY